MRHGRTGLRRGLGIVGAVLAAGLLFELIARQIYWLPYMQHPRLSSILPGGTNARFCREGCARTTWVADGMRRQDPRDPALPAVLVLGDSYTEALMIDDERVFTRGIERALEASDPRVQVLNMGRSGASTPDYAALAAFYLEQVDPLWTVIQLRWSGLEADAFSPAETHFRRTDDGGVTVVEVPPRPSRINRYLTPIRQTSAFANLVTRRLKEFRAAAAAEPPLFFGGHARAIPASAPVWPVAAELEAVVAAFGGRVTFLFIPEFDPRDPTAKRETERRFDAACASHAWSCVNLRSSFPDFAARHEAPAGFPNTRFNWGHMNEAGHVAAGELLGAELRRLRSRALF